MNCMYIMHICQALTLSSLFIFGKMVTAEVSPDAVYDLRGERVPG